MTETTNIKIERNKQNGGLWADFIKGDKKYYADLCYSIFQGPEFVREGSLYQKSLY